MAATIPDEFLDLMPEKSRPKDGADPASGVPPARAGLLLV
jgi:hypothetical protein